MKKVLLTTSALAGLSAVAATSAGAAEAPVLTFSGNLSYEYIFVDNEVRGNGTNDGHVLTANEQQSELVWDARGTADNGLEYGANIQWRWARADTGFDESWIDFRGSWGRLYIGAEDGVVDLLVVDGRSNQVGTWGTDGNGAVRAESALESVAAGTQTHYYQSPLGHTFDANKIGYVTPSFGGFSAGVSFAPDGGDNQQANFVDNGVANSIEVAARYNAQFSGVGVNVGVGYFNADANQAGTTSSAAGLEDHESYQIGAQVDFAGFSLVGSWFDSDDSGAPVGDANFDAGSGWTVGAAYSFGPTGISASYQQTESNPAGAINEIESSIVHAGINYQVAEGLSARINGYYIDTEDELAGTVDGDSTVIIIGTRVQF